LARVYVKELPAQSGQYGVAAGVRYVEDLEQGRPDDYEEEHAQHNRAHLALLLSFLGYWWRYRQGLLDVATLVDVRRVDLALDLHGLVVRLRLGMVVPSGSCFEQIIIIGGGALTFSGRGISN